MIRHQAYRIDLLVERPKGRLVREADCSLTITLNRGVESPFSSLISRQKFKANVKLDLEPVEDGIDKGRVTPPMFLTELDGIAY
jgi:hypothetical protein